MSLQPKYISWILVIILASIIGIQYRGASKAEERAAQLEAQAKDIDAQLQKFELESKQAQALAESRYQASLVESATLRSILAKGSQTKRQDAPQSNIGAIREALDNSKGLPPSRVNPAPQSPCDAFIYQGSPLVIEGFQVLVCDQKSVVQAEAAVALHDEKALVDKLNTELAEDTSKLALQEKDLAAYKQAEAGYKKAAHKSRIKKALGIVEKVAIFAGGLYLGHIAH